ncbi:HU family DNA-binding protein [uncultured Bacteroides sp.]|uniref:HU family DNA-binding protein n=1 Tax=uncultured Bacteroides sp. TaxID=162156 RepID=UPI0025998853|nr:HU family DNA-binding protein [uncultured Bacteroides sp.]
MRKKELLTRIAHKTGKKRDDVRIIVEELIAEMKETMISGENIYIRGFGSFVTKKRASKIARNIKANCGFVVPSHNIAVFKPCKEFAGKVRGTI